jgi:biotin carboxyl carrier protein
METTLKAPYTGHVSCIHCKEGDKVSPGMILVEIEKESSP